MKKKMSRRMRRRIRRRRICLAVLLTILIAFIGWSIIDTHRIEVSRFSVSGAPESFEGFKIAQISDLHNAEFGSDNQKLIDILAEESPDAIVFTGDLVDARHTDLETAESFVEKCTAIANCYYVTGNHEATLGERYTELEDQMTEMGVTVLRNGSVRIRLGNDFIRFLGLDDPGFFATSDVNAEINAVLESLETDDYTILLAHRPEYVAEYANWGIDLVLSGHAHGGQVRLPFIGGLYAPGQGFFPKYTSGEYIVDGVKMIVSRGLGNSLCPIRVNDRPQVVIVTLEQ